MEKGFLSREVVTPGNNSPEKAQKLRELQILSEREEIPAARRIIDSIDFVVLEDILQDKLRRSGIRQEQTNFLPADRIVFYKQDKVDKVSGDYDPISNLISIDYHRLLKLAPQEIESLILHTLIHEQIHAVSKTYCEIDGYGFDSKRNSGLAEWSADDEKGFKFQCFEEGATEKLALEVMEEYCRTTGTSRENLQKEKTRVVPYTKYVKLVNLFIAKFSQMAGMPEDTVWRAILEGKFVGRNISDGDLRAEINENFPPGIMEKIQDNKVDEALLELEKFVPF